MNEKKSFGRKAIALALTVAMASTMTTFAASSSISAANTTDVNTQAVQPTTGDASTFSWDNATVYFLLTDRFKNGDTSNDHSYGRGLDKNGNVVNCDNTATFHGGDFAGITQEIESGYFEKLGVNAIWLSAPYEQVHGYVVGSNGNSFPHYSYHGYYVSDFTESDKNFGTKEEFRKLVDTAHEHGIRIVMDIVMNHAGYNSLKDMSEYNFGTLKSGWEDYYYAHQNVNNEQYHSYVDYNSSANDWAKWWGPNWIRSGLPGYNQGGGEVAGSLEGLPDFITESSSSVGIPEMLKTKWTKEGTYDSKVSKYGSSGTVRSYLVKWLSEWVREFGVDGFRCDTAKHVEKESWKALKTECTNALKEWKAANPTKAIDDLDFWMTGEHFGHGLGKDDYYTNGFDSMINFEFAPNTSSGNIPSAGSVDATYSRYANSINNDTSFNVLSYISSHDTILAGGDRKYDGSFLLMLPGAVQIYYGDETSRPLAQVNSNSTAGAGHQLRSDMNWSNLDTATLSHWQKVGSFRNNHIAVGAGQHSSISSYNQSTGYTFSRTYDNGSITDSVVATLFAPANTSLDVDVSSVWSNGTTVTNAYDGTTAVVTNGKAKFNTGANGTILIEGPQSSISVSLRSATGSNSFEGSTTLTLSLKGADSASVKIDNAAPITVRDGESFQIGENTPEGGKVNVTVTATNGEDTVEKTYVYNKKDPNAVTRIYFDNSSYNWSNVYAYVYSGEGTSAKEVAAWPGVKLTNTSPTSGYYCYDVPDDFVNGSVIFSDGTGSATNRYPADMQPGLKIGETSHLFSSGNKWTEYSETVTPTQPPTTVGSTYVRGDVNSDGKVDMKDCVVAQLATLGTSTLTTTQKLAADVNGDGKVAVADVVAIMRYLVGYSNTYNIGEVVQGGEDPTSATVRPTEAPTQRPTEAPTTPVGQNVVTLDASKIATGTERWAVYCWKTDTDNKWIDMNASGSQFSVSLPDGYTNFIICRMNGGTTENNWNNRWNQSDDLKYSGGNFVTATGWGAGNKFTTTQSTK